MFNNYAAMFSQSLRWQRPLLGPSPGLKRLSRGFLHDCEIFANLHLACVLSSSEQSDPVSEAGSGDIMVDDGPTNQQLPALETFEEPKQMKPKNRGFCGRRVRGSRVQESRGRKKKKYN